MLVEISVIVPAYNEERLLPRLLEDVSRAKQQYRRGADAVEVLVADNGSTDATVDIARAFGCRIVHVELRRIGAVRNGGAHAAEGRILAFVDADARIHGGTFNAIDDYFTDRTRIVAATGILPERRSLGIDVTWLMLGLTTALVGYSIPRRRHQCAPTGLVCCRQADWAAVGGYSETLLFAEDARFLLDLKKLGRSRGASVGWLRDVPATFSTRKFDEHGDWHYVTLPLRFVLGFVWYPALRKWAESYWYGRQRERSSVVPPPNEEL